MIKYILINLFFLLIAFSVKSYALFEDESKVILVHVSQVMSKNSTKIAGSQWRNLGDDVYRIDPEGTNIRERMTFHNCMGGMRPYASHRSEIMGMAVPSDFDMDENLCAYLDPLSAFSGEIYGGFPKDFMTIDRHTYGKSSIIVVPLCRTEEFHLKNPGYKGRLVVYDPQKMTMRDKINEVFNGLPNVPRFDEINKAENFSDFIDFCSFNRYYYGWHDTSPFRLFETAIERFKNIIDSIHQGNQPILLPADQIAPLSNIINILQLHIFDEAGPPLSYTKQQALKKWIKETNEWLNLFCVDADLRTNQNKSLFINNPFLQECLNHRGETDYLYVIGTPLPLLLKESVLNKIGKDLFPTKFLEKTSKSSLSLIQELQQKLIDRGYPDHGHGLMIIYLLQGLIPEKMNEMAFPLDNEELFLKTVQSLKASPQSRSNIRFFLECIAGQDLSFRNERFVSWLNGPSGRALRQRLWRDQSTINYWTLLRIGTDTGILFSDLDTFASTANSSLAEKRFIQIVRQWVLEQCAAHFSFIPESRALIPAKPRPTIMGEFLKNPHFSLLNYRCASQMAGLFELYRIALHTDIDDKNKHLQTFMDQGCFESWKDLFHQLFDLKEVRPKDIKKILRETFWISRSVLFLGKQMEECREQRKYDLKRFEELMPDAERIYNRIATGGDNEVSINLLKLCIRGITLEYGENKVIVEPNWERAQIVCKKLYETVNSKKQRKLDRLMEPVLKQKGNGC
ncbi:MAG: hypothetical protein BGO67_03485 [Alphaproteobacteria bacterium 41-28]|nr:MAG: hypothetical protein BGO67_03485 [Alphaproteobacteria bacterium 41-28]